MNVEKSFSFPFEDKDWLGKLGLGAVISLVPVLNFAWSGYMVGIIRNVMSQAAEPLPTWDNLEKKFTDGLLLFGAGVVYALPMLVLFFLPLSLAGFSSILAGDNRLQDLGRVLGETGGVLFFCLLCVGMVYGLMLSVLYPAVLVMFAREGTFASCFRLREIFGMISRNAGSFFTAWGLSLIAGIGVGLLIGFVNLIVSWVPCIGWIIGTALSLVSGVYISSVYAHLFGQFGIEAFERNQLMAVTS
jgi:hypothetical protein